MSAGKNVEIIFSWCTTNKSDLKWCNWNLKQHFRVSRDSTVPNDELEQLSIGFDFSWIDFSSLEKKRNRNNIEFSFIEIANSFIKTIVIPLIFPFIVIDAGQGKVSIQLDSNSPIFCIENDFLYSLVSNGWITFVISIKYLFNERAKWPKPFQ